MEEALVLITMGLEVVAVLVDQPVAVAIQHVATAVVAPTVVVLVGQPVAVAIQHLATAVVAPTPEVAPTPVATPEVAVVTVVASSVQAYRTTLISQN